MKKIFLGWIIVFLITILLQSPNASANSFREVKAVNASSLVIKADASKSANTVATLKRGEFVTVFSTNNGWAYIQAGQKKGYVDGAYLTKPKSTIKIASSKSGLVVKETMSKSGKTVAKLKYNMIVEDFGSVGGGWSFVQYGNVTGYVATSFINTPKTTTKYTTSRVPVRNIASPSGDIVNAIEGGQKVTVHSTLAGWSYVSTSSTRGYIPAADLIVLKTKTIGYANEYLPNCPKKYEYEHTSSVIDNNRYDENANGYYYGECKFYNNGRAIVDPGDEYGLHNKSYEISSKGYLYYLLYENGYEYQFPLTLDKTWRHEKYGQYEYYRVLSMNEIVTTPAGTFFNVIKISISTDSYYDYHYQYLAPGAGIIKETYGGDGEWYIIELASFY